MTLRGDETRREGGNDALDQCRELMERFEQRLTLDNPRFIERYLESKLLLRIRFFIWGSNEEFEAVFQREPTIGGTNEHVHAGEGGFDFRGKTTAPSHVLADINASRLRADRQQQAVLFDVVQFVEGPQEVIPSLVWFEQVDRIERILMGSLYFSALFGFVFSGIVGKRKVDPVLVRRLVPGIATNDLKSEMVQGGHEVLDGVSGNQGQRFGNGMGARDVINQLSRLRIVLGPDSIRVGSKKSDLLTPAISDVLFGPFDF